jgi:hypothetical protein
VKSSFLIKNILLGLLGLATVATFITPTELVDEIWFGVGRVAVMLAFLALLLWLYGRETLYNLSDSVKAAPRFARDLAATWAPFDSAGVRRALVETMDQFRLLAIQAAQRWSLDYPEALDRRATVWVRTWQ